MFQNSIQPYVEILYNDLIVREDVADMEDVCSNLSLIVKNILTMDNLNKLKAMDVFTKVYCSTYMRAVLAADMEAIDVMYQSEIIQYFNTHVDILTYGQFIPIFRHSYIPFSIRDVYMEDSFMFDDFIRNVAVIMMDIDYEEFTVTSTSGDFKTISSTIKMSMRSCVNNWYKSFVNEFKLKKDVDIYLSDIIYDSVITYYSNAAVTKTRLWNDIYDTLVNEVSVYHVNVLYDPILLFERLYNAISRTLYELIAYIVDRFGHYGLLTYILYTSKLLTYSRVNRRTGDLYGYI